MTDRLISLEESRAIMHAVEIPPPKDLATLRTIVLGISETRLPQWHFSIAPDFVLRIQARPGERLLFQGAAIEGEGIRPVHFTSKVHRQEVGFRHATFEIRTTPEAWLLIPRRWFWAEAAALAALKARLLAGIQRLARLDRALMFSANCLLCGRPLTDPVSMARWIGPECAGNHSLDVWLLNSRHNYLYAGGE